MAKITFVAHDGTRHEVEAKTGQNLMETAVSNGVPGIDADCGGACACATCHVFITPDWTDTTGAPSDMEVSMLDFAENVQPTSRLACQIEVTDKHDGLTVKMPEAQH
ncbi:MAG: 2Fe-2S iron-sulfur cluster-binding protein [Pseudomonadota bacterium]